MKAGFLTRPDFGAYPPGRFTLRGDLIYASELFQEIFIVEAGSTTDFDSVPWLFLWLIKPNREQRYPAVVHDGAYGHKGLKIYGGGFRKMSRKEADKLYLEALESEGFRVLDSKLSYAGLRVGGWWRWHITPSLDETSALPTKPLASVAPSIVEAKQSRICNNDVTT